MNSKGVAGAVRSNVLVFSLALMLRGSSLQVVPSSPDASPVSSKLPMAVSKTPISTSFLPDIAPLLGSQLRAVRLKERLSPWPRNSPENSPGGESLYGTLQRVRGMKRPFASFVECARKEMTLEALRDASRLKLRPSLAPSKSDSLLDRRAHQSGLKVVAKLRRIVERDQCLHNKSISFLGSKPQDSPSPTPENLNRSALCRCTSKNYFPLSFTSLKRPARQTAFTLPKKSKAPSLEPCVSTVNLSCKFPKIKISALNENLNIRKECEVHLKQQKATLRRLEKEEKHREKRQSSVCKVTVAKAGRKLLKREDSISISSWRSDEERP